MKVKEGLGYSFEPDKYMFGMCEEFEGSLDKGADPMTTIDLVDVLGAKSMRIWMHHKRLLELNEKGELVFKQEVFLRYRKYVEELARRNIRILAMNHNYVFPSSYGGDKNSVSEMPLPNSEVYFEHMRLVEKGCEMIAAAFPEIEYFECGNEVNMNFYLAKPGYTAHCGKNNVYDPKYCYNNLEKAEITADLCYYSRLGVKKGNPRAKVVFPAPTPYRGYPEMAEFLEFTYRAIESGNFPRGEEKSTNPDDYFDVQCYHAYNFGGESKVLTDGGEMVLEIMRRHGDGGKKIFITEFGYHDHDFVKTRGMTKEAADALQASFFDTDFQAFRSIGNIETVFVFRLYDWVSGPGIEVDFGLFTSPQSEQGIVPKAKGKKLFKIFQGEGADESVLYKYAK